MEQLNRFTDRLEYRNWVNLSALLDWTDIYTRVNSIYV